MLRMILSLYLFVIFVFADSCDFSNKNQKECKLSVDNPPIFLHKFIDANNNITTKYSACIYDGKFQYEDKEYDVIDCSIVQNGKLLTEGIFFENKNKSNDEKYSLMTNKEIELENENIMLVVAGDMILDSGIRINTKEPKNFLLEIIEGSNGKSNLILQRGAKINANAIIMPSGVNTTIKLNTFFGGSNEKGFIESIDNDDATKRFEMDTNISADGIYAIDPKDASIVAFDGNIICGPEINPLDISNTNYLLKRLDNNNVSVVNMDINPNYGLFIESGKISSISSLNSAKIQGQNGGKCNSPTQIAFNKEIIDEYNARNSKIVESTQQNADSIETDTLNTLTINEGDTNEEEYTDSYTDTSTNFAIIEQDIYNKYSKSCNGNMECLNRAINPYKNIIWNKVSSLDKVNSIYVVNLTKNNIDVNCEVLNYYGKNIQNSFNLSKNNMFEKIDLKFPKSTNQIKIVCQNQNLRVETNAIQVNPAKFDLKTNFENKNFNPTLSLKAGVIDVSFEGSNALTLEGEIDTGFNGKIVADNNNLKFTQIKCGYPNNDVFIQEPMVINFKNGKADQYLTSFVANTITNGDLSIDFNIEGDYKKCGSEFAPKCTEIKITKNINVIPANFMIKTDIVSPYKIAYYGQIEDRNTFKYNPIINIQLSAINNKNEVININQTCNHGVMELSLDSKSKIEFKRSITDRLNAKVNVYLDEFNNKQIANIDAYFGISKIFNDYGNLRKINQSDLVEAQEVNLTDFKFNITFKSNGNTYDYNDLIVYDRLADDSMPIGVLFARGKIEKNIIYTNDNKANLDLKYLVYCKSCDKKILEKYLGDMTMDSPNWYINRQNPSDLFVSNEFIKTDLKVKNSNTTTKGRQQIVFDSEKNGEYNVVIRQKDSEFAPYLNYNESFKNSYLENSFNITIKNKPEIKEKITETKKIEQPKTNKNTKKSTPTKTNTKKQKSANSVELDIEE